MSSIGVMYSTSTSPFGSPVFQPIPLELSGKISQFVHSSNDFDQLEIKEIEKKTSMISFAKKVMFLLSLVFLLIFGFSVGVLILLSPSEKETLSTNSWIGFLSMMFGLVCLFLLGYDRTISRRFPMNYIFLFGFILGQTGLVIYLSSVLNPFLIFFIIGLLTSIVLIIFLYLLCVNTKIGVIIPFLCIFVIISSISITYRILVRINLLELIPSSISVLIFGIYLILHIKVAIELNDEGYESNDYVLATVGVFTGISHIFVSMMRVMTHNKF